ncbi:MAG: phosphomannose isomerase type II C-terminal cupin domain, partial [Thermodesulfobacteriota bacterium]
ELFPDDVGNEESKGDGKLPIAGRVEKPWGHYSVIERGDGYQVKHIEVRPNQRISLQLHQRRCESWVIVQGVGMVTIGGFSREVKAFEKIFVPRGTQHRIENIGQRTLILIEVGHGDYLEEDDILRLQDDYGRVYVPGLEAVY